MSRGRQSCTLLPLVCALLPVLRSSTVFVSKATGECAGIKGNLPTTAGDGLRIRSFASAQTLPVFPVACDVPLSERAPPWRTSRLDLRRADCTDCAEPNTDVATSDHQLAFVIERATYLKF